MIVEVLKNKDQLSKLDSETIESLMGKISDENKILILEENYSLLDNNTITNIVGKMDEVNIKRVLESPLILSRFWGSEVKNLLSFLSEEGKMDVLLNPDFIIKDKSILFDVVNTENQLILLQNDDIISNMTSIDISSVLNKIDLEISSDIIEKILLNLNEKNKIKMFNSSGIVSRIDSAKIHEIINNMDSSYLVKALSRPVIKKLNVSELSLLVNRLYLGQLIQLFNSSITPTNSLESLDPSYQKYDRDIIEKLIKSLYSENVHNVMIIGKNSGQLDERVYNILIEKTNIDYTNKVQGVETSTLNSEEGIQKDFFDKMDDILNNIQNDLDSKISEITDNLNTEVESNNVEEEVSETTSESVVEEETTPEEVGVNDTVVEESVEGTSNINDENLLISQAELTFRSRYGDAVSGYSYGKEYKFKFDESGNSYVEWMDYLAYLQLSDQYFSNVKYSLTSEEKTSIKKYLSEDNDLSYKTMNGIMRDNLFEFDADGNVINVVMHELYGTYSKSIEWYVNLCGSLDKIIFQNKQAVLDVDNAIRQSLLQDDMITFRGFSNLASSKRLFGVDFTSMTPKEIEAVIMTKGHFVTEGFFSTSVTSEATPIQNAKIVYEIRNKVGTPALDTSQIGYSSDEEEIIIAPNTPYKYTGVKVEVNSDGTKVVHIQCELADGYNSDMAKKLFRQKVDTTFENIDSKLQSSKYYKAPSIINNLDSIINNLDSVIKSFEDKL